MSPALAGGFFTAEPLGKPRHLLIHSSADRCLDSFHILAMVNRVVMSMYLLNYGFLQIYAQERNYWIKW